MTFDIDYANEKKKLEKNNKKVKKTAENMKMAFECVSATKIQYLITTFLFKEKTKRSFQCTPFFEVR